MVRVVSVVVALAAVCGLWGAQFPVVHRATAEPSKSAETSKSEDIRRLLEISNVPGMADGMVGSMLDAMEEEFRQAYPRMPADAMAVLLGEMEGALTSAKPELLQMLGTLYDREYTHEEVRALLSFYRSPLGQKLLNTTPRLAQQGTRLTDLWTQKHATHAGRTAMRKIETMGYDTGAFGK